jgi:hypothetical protein
MIARFKREPAVVIGVLAAAVLAAVQSLAGNGILSGSVVDWLTNALDPSHGWALPIVVGIITRFFVSPATK